jgi:hypothetical protein
LTFSDSDVEITSGYGGVIICGKKRLLNETLSDNVGMGCCLDIPGQQFERQNTMEEGVSSQARSSNPFELKAKKKKKRANSECSDCYCH